MTKETFIENVKKHKVAVTVIFCVLLMILCTLSIFVAGSNICGDDLWFHCARINGVAEAIKGGQFPIKYYNSWGNGGGCFSPIFYGDFFLILPALFVLMGVPLGVSYYFFVYMLFFGLWLAMFFLAKKYLKHNIFSLICATVFSLSQYVFVDIFKRAAIGEVLGFIFLIVMLIGIFNMLHENYSKPWILSIAFVGLLFSHMTMLFVSAVILVIVVLFNSKTLLKSKKFWLNSLFAIGLFLIVGLYSLASFLEMYFADVYQVSNPWTVPSQNSQDLLEILGITTVYSMGIFSVLSFVLRLFIKKTDKNASDMKIVDKFLLVSAIVVLLVSKIFPWQLFDKLLAFLQFPWRLYTISSILLCLALAIELKHIANFNKKAVAVFVSCLAAFFFVYNNTVVPTFLPVRFETSVNTKLEWFPEKVNLEEIGKQKVRDEYGSVILHSRDEFSTSIRFESTKNSEYYVVPIIYYKGYSATVTKENGETVKLNVRQSEDGMIIVETNGKTGDVVVCYSGTTIQHVTFLISLVGSVVLAGGVIVVLILKKRKNKEKLIKK